jgi:pyruvate kinase
MQRRTKIIATIGPASLEEEVFSLIIKEGADYIRINTAHSDESQHLTIKENLKKISKEVEVIFDVLSLESLDKIIQYKPSLIALSFTESCSQIQEIRKKIPNCKVISKIESEKGVLNFNEIINESDGVMIARGDLGRAVTLEKVPCIQKRFTKQALIENKFLVVATEMLLSMTENEKPTRAEVSDVANAVFEKASAVMLSEETAIGKNPVQAVRFMRTIIEATEKCETNGDI